MKDLENAIKILSDVPRLNPIHHPDLADWLNNLGLALWERYKLFGEMDCLEGAIAAYQKAASSMPVDDPERASTLGNLGGALRLLYEHNGAMEDLEDAVSTSKEAVAASVYHLNRDMCLHNLGSALLRSYENLGK